MRTAWANLSTISAKLGVGRIVGRGEDDDVAVDAVDIAADGIADQAVVKALLADAQKSSASAANGFFVSRSATSSVPMK